MKNKLSRIEIVKENISSFSKLSPSEKIRFVEKAKKRLKYYRTLELTKRFINNNENSTSRR